MKELKDVIGIGPKILEHLNKYGINTVKDLVGLENNPNKKEIISSIPGLKCEPYGIKSIKMQNLINTALKEVK